MLTRFLLLTVSLGYHYCVAQQFDTIALYFDVAESTLLEKHESTLDSLSLTKRLISISIFGYADSTGTAKSNSKLAELRAQEVKEYFNSHHRHVVITKARGLGETRSLDQAPLWTHRKVEIISKKQPKFSAKNAAIPQGFRPVAKRPAPALLRLDSLEVGEKIKLKNVHFIPGRHLPVPASRIALESLYETLKANPQVKIEIQGHICCHKPPHDGIDMDTGKRELSLNRAKYVWLYLVEKGIDKERLQYKGFGSSQPKVWPEQSPTDQNANRRVEIKIVAK